MNLVRLYYIKPEKTATWQPGEKRLEELMATLSEDKRSALTRLVNRADQIASLLGLLLLEKTARDEGVAGFRLGDINYPRTGKPVWCSNHDTEFDFNISHSSGLVLVAASRTLKLGVDAEKIRHLKNMSFRRVLTADELQAIENDPALFFTLWSRKEAVVKAADTAGISRMHDVELTADRAMLDGKIWFISDLAGRMQCDKDYAVNLATSAPVEQIIIKEVLPGDIG